MTGDTKLPKLRPLATKRNPNARCCGVCGREGGGGMTTALRFAGYEVPAGTIGYAHSDCIMRERKKLQEKGRASS